MSSTDKRKLLQTAKLNNTKRPLQSSMSKSSARPKTSCQVKPLFINNNKIDEEEAKLDLMYLIMQSSTEKFKQEEVNLKYKTLNKFYEEKQKYINGFTKADEQFYRYNILYGSKSHSILRSYSPKMRPKTASMSSLGGKNSKEIIAERCFKQDEMNKLFLAKCVDLRISSKPHLEEKFNSYCEKMCLNRTVDFTECNLGIAFADVLSFILTYSNKIAKLILSKNNLQDDGLSSLLDGLNQNLTLVHLDVSSNDISHRIGAKLFKVIERHCSLISLDISSREGINRNRLTHEGIIGLEAVLKNNRFLEFLNISGNSIRSEGVKIILNGLSSNHTLHVLNLSNNEIDSSGMKHMKNYCEKGLIAQTKLNDIDLSENPIGNEVYNKVNVKGIEYLGNIINHSMLSTLKKLNLSSCKFDFYGFYQFCSDLQLNKRLEILDVSRNILDSEFFPQIKNFLVNMHFIKELNMSRCKLGNIGCQAIGEGFLNNYSLVKLDISDNKISDEGFIHIATLIGKNTTLEEINACKNSINDKSAFPFFKNLINNPSMKVLNFYDNQIQNEAGIQMIETLRNNNNIIKLKLRYNRIQLRIIEEISRLVKLNNDDDKKKKIPNIKKEIRNIYVNDENFKETSEKINVTKNNLANLKDKTTEDIEHLMKLRVDDENKAKYYCKEAEIIESHVKKISDEVRSVYREKNIYEDKMNREKNILENEINNILDKIRNTEQIYKELKNNNETMILKYEVELKKIQNEHKISLDKLNLAIMSQESLKNELSNKDNLLNNLENKILIEEEKKDSNSSSQIIQKPTNPNNNMNIKISSIKNNDENKKKTPQDSAKTIKENKEKNDTEIKKEKANVKQKSMAKSSSQPLINSFKESAKQKVQPTDMTKTEKIKITVKDKKKIPNV